MLERFVIISLVLLYYYPSFIITDPAELVIVRLVATEPVVFNIGPLLTPPVGCKDKPCVEFETSNL